MHTLLLADDSITVQRVIALTFAEEPIQVVAVSDGRQAMEKIAAERPDIVLAATTLSQVSGYELAHFVRSTADLQGVPVLLLSGAFETVDEAKLKTSGGQPCCSRTTAANSAASRQCAEPWRTTPRKLRSVARP